VAQGAPYFSPTSATHTSAFRMTPDDKRFVFLRETTPSERNELIVVQHWTEELKKRARK
jgi:hypothetical protein